MLYETLRGCANTVRPQSNLDERREFLFMVENEAQQVADILLSEIRWIVADETRKYDDSFQLPIVNMEYSVERLREFLTWRENQDGSVLVKVVVEKLVKVLSELAEYGEDPRKLADWVLSVRDFNVSNYDSRAQWLKYFQHVLKNNNENSGESIELAIVSVAQSYMNKVDKPFSSFRNFNNQCEALWLQSSRNRSAFDNRLYEAYYKDFSSSPPGLLLTSYLGRLQRCWWLVETQSVSVEVRNYLHEGLVNFATEHIAKGGYWHWEDTHPIDLAFAWNDLERMKDSE